MLFLGHITASSYLLSFCRKRLFDQQAFGHYYIFPLSCLVFSSDVRFQSHMFEIVTRPNIRMEYDHLVGKGGRNESVHFSLLG